MSSRGIEALTGAVVLAVALGFVVYAGRATGVGPQRGADYPLTASFRSAEGISLGTDVRLAGVKVGRVTGLRLDPETYRAEAELRLDAAIEVPDDSAAVVASEGLLGGTFVEIVPGGSPGYYAPGEEILDTQGAVSLVSLLMTFVGSAAGEAAGAGSGNGAGAPASATQTGE